MGGRGGGGYSELLKAIRYYHGNNAWVGDTHITQ